MYSYAEVLETRSVYMHGIWENYKEQGIDHSEDVILTTSHVCVCVLKTAIHM